MFDRIESNFITNSVRQRVKIYIFLIKFLKILYITSLIKFIVYMESICINEKDGATKVGCLIGCLI